MEAWRWWACGHLGAVAHFRVCLPPTLDVYCYKEMATALHVELIAALDIVKADAKLNEFFIKEGILDCEAVALLAGSEDKLEEKIFPMIKAGGVPIEQLKDQVAMKKLWKACRTRMSAPSKSSGDRSDHSDEVLPHATRANTVTAWKAKHNFAMSGERLLSEQLIKKLYDGIYAEQCKLDIYLMESLKLQSSLGNSPKLMIPCEFRPGVPIVPEVITAEAVQSSMQAYERARAFFGTLAWVAVNKGDWFTFQDFLFVDDRMMELLQFTKDGRRPPLSHFTMAWAQTLRFIIYSIRTTGRTMGPLMRETSSWTPPLLDFVESVGWSRP